jgi:hypothetical protein
MLSEEQGPELETQPLTQEEAPPSKSGKKHKHESLEDVSAPVKKHHSWKKKIQTFLDLRAPTVDDHINVAKTIIALTASCEKLLKVF